MTFSGFMYQFVVPCLVSVLLLALIFVLVRVFEILGNLSHTLRGVEDTRKEVDKTVQRVNTLLDTELKQTMTNVQLTTGHLERSTRALGEASQSAGTMLKSIPLLNRGAVPAKRSSPASNPMMTLGLQLALQLLSFAAKQLSNRRKKKE